MVATIRSRRGASKVAIVAVAIVAVAIVAVATAAVGFFYVTGSGSSSCASATSSENPAASGAIRISEYSGSSNSANPPGYRPDTITVVIGINSTVTWTNDDSAAHTVTSTSAPAGTCFGS